MGRGLAHVNQHDEDYVMKTTSGLALQRRCGLLSSYFGFLFYYVEDLCWQIPCSKSLSRRVNLVVIVCEGLHAVRLIYVLHEIMVENDKTTKFNMLIVDLRLRPGLLLPPGETV